MHFFKSLMLAQIAILAANAAPLEPRDDTNPSLIGGLYTITNAMSGTMMMFNPALLKITGEKPVYGYTQPFAAISLANKMLTWLPGQSHGRSFYGRSTPVPPPIPPVRPVLPVLRSKIAGPKVYWMPALVSDLRLGQQSLSTSRKHLLTAVYSQGTDYSIGGRALGCSGFCPVENQEAVPEW